MLILDCTCTNRQEQLATVPEARESVLLSLSLRLVMICQRQVVKGPIGVKGSNIKVKGGKTDKLEA